MKQWSVWVLSLVLVSAVSAQEAKDAAKDTKETKDVKTVAKFYFAKVTERGGGDAYRVLSGEEFKSLQEEINAEDRYFARAVQAAEAEWRKGEDTKKKTFPRSAVKPRKLDALQTFNDRALADKKLESYQKQEANAAKRDKLHPPAKSKRTAAQQAADAEGEASRIALEDQARSIFEGKLAELIAAKKPATAQTPAPAVAPAVK